MRFPSFVFRAALTLLWGGLVLVAAETAPSGPAVPPPPAPAAAAPLAEAPLSDGLYAIWETPRGVITAELFPAEAPLTVANFVGLAEGTIPFSAPGRTAEKPYFDGLLFHRVVPGFVVQGGDPLGTGEGGPGYEFGDEFNPARTHGAVGILSMANGGPGTNGSQFFLTLAPVDRLNYMHTVFGKVVRGLEVLPLIQPNDPMARVRIERVGTKAAAYRVTPAEFERLRAARPAIVPRDPAKPVLFVDEAGLTLPGYLTGWENAKLHNYALSSGRTIYVRCVPAFSALPAAPEGKNPLRQYFATLTGNDPDAALLVFLADEKRWRLWFGDNLVRRLGVDPAQANSEEGRKQLHAIKTKVTDPAGAAWDPAKHGRTIDAAITQLIGLLDAAGK